MNFDKRMKNLDWKDVGLTKWSAIAFALFVVAVWPAFSDWVVSVHWGWFLVVSLILGVRPLYRFFK